LSSRRASALLFGLFLGAAAAAPAVEPLVFECRRLEHGGRTPFGVVVGDWNGDGKPDLAVSNAGSSDVSVLLGTGGGSFRSHGALDVGGTPRSITAGDVNGDRFLDLVVGHAIPNTTLVLRGDGRGGFEPAGAYVSGESPFEVELSDADSDGVLDLLVANESNMPRSPERGRIAIHPGRGDGTFGEPEILQAGRFPAALEVAELDGRPGLDLAVASWGSDSVSLFFRDGKAFVPGPTIEPGIDNPYSLEAADLDGDGRTDLALTHIHGQVRVLFGTGSGEFGEEKALRVGRGVRWVTSADLDGDGRLDLVTTDVAVDTVSILRNAGGRTFHPAQPIPVGDHPRMARAADLDGDGRLDLVVTQEADASLGILLQRPPGRGRACPVKGEGR
jgi:hypothetical protein